MNPEIDRTGNTSATYGGGYSVTSINTTGLAAGGGQAVVGAGIPLGTLTYGVPDQFGDPNSLDMDTPATTTVAANPLAFGLAGSGNWNNSVNWTAPLTSPASITGDTVQFDSASYGSFQPYLNNVGGAAPAVRGFIFGDATGQVRDNTGALAGAGTTGALTISSGVFSSSTVTAIEIGDAGIVMNANSGNVTFANGTVGVFASETWSNASSNVLTISASITHGDYLGAYLGTLNITNTGTGSVVTSLGNDATGILPTWVSFTNATGTSTPPIPAAARSANSPAPPLRLPAP